MTSAGGFTTVFGRGLVGELPNFVHRPYVVVTMADLWPRFADELNLDALMPGAVALAEDCAALGLLVPAVGAAGPPRR